MRKRNHTASRFVVGRRRAVTVFLLLMVFAFGMIVMPGMAYSQCQPDNTHLAAVPSFHELLANSHQVMLLIDLVAGTIVDTNPAALEFCGYSHSWLTAMTTQEINRLTPAQVEDECARVAVEF